MEIYLDPGRPDQGPARPPCVSTARQARGMSPQPFKIVKIAGLVVKNMNDNIHIIEKNPPGVIFAFHMAALDLLLLQTEGHIVGNGPDMPVRISGRYHEIAGDGVQPPQVKNDDIPALFFFARSPG